MRAKTLSDLAREALTRSEVLDERNGVLLFPVQPDAQVVTQELVYLLQDDLEVIPV